MRMIRRADDHSIDVLARDDLEIVLVHVDRRCCAAGIAIELLDERFTIARARAVDVAHGDDVDSARLERPWNVMAARNTSAADLADAQPLGRCIGAEHACRHDQREAESGGSNGNCPTEVAAGEGGPGGLLHAGTLLIDRSTQWRLGHTAGSGAESLEKGEFDNRERSSPARRCLLFDIETSIGRY